MVPGLLCLLPPALFAGTPVADALCLAAGLPGGTDPASVNARNFRIDRSGEAGIRYFRHDFLWDQIEPEPGEFDFEAMDRAVDAALEAGIEYIGILCYGNPAYSSQTDDDPAYPPDDPADFANYVYETVSHFHGRVHNWEIWNEPNVGLRFWKPTFSGDPEAYGDLLELAYDAAKAADPACTVALGGTFYPHLVVESGEDFLEEVYAIHPDLGDYFDVLAFHPYRYPFTAPEVQNGYQDSLLTAIETMRDVLERHGDADKPIWITEMGWHTATLQPVFSGVTFEEQARYLARAYVLALSTGVDKVCWYTFEDGEHARAWQEDAFGLFVHDEDWSDTRYPPAKPAYYALETLSRTLEDLEFTADLTATLGLDGQGYAFRFDGPLVRVVVAWTLETAGTVPVTLTHLPATVTVVNLVGTAQTLTTQDGTLTLEVSPNPLYVVASQSAATSRGRR